jgi:radical SAM superfamily enzyme YgiQ (UPF0313 family)
MKILLIKPPLNPNLLTLSLYEPLELEYLAASVKDHDVRILDMRIDKDLRRELSGFRPDLAGITAYTCDYNTVVQILKEIKEFDSSIRTVVGGHHATFMPQDFVLPFVDTVFIGYSDHSFPCYVNAFNERDKIRMIPDLMLVDGSNVLFTARERPSPDLDRLPMPDRVLVRKYSKMYHDPARNRLVLLMSSRGCPFRCNFCACWKLMDGKYTCRSAESVVEEMKTIPDEREIIYFSDDNTFHDPARMYRFCELVRRYGIKKQLQMYARTDTIVKHRELFSEMASAGLKYLTVGFESFSNSDLDFYGKRTSVEVNNRAVRILKDLDIYILSHFIVRPEYTGREFDSLFRYVSDNNLFRPAYPVLTPLPGTALYEKTLSTFIISNFDFFDFTHSVLPTKLSTKEFYSQLTRIYVRSFSIPRYLKHRFNRAFSRKPQKYFTDNTDGVNVYRLLLISFHTIRLYFRMRFAYRKKGRFTVNNLRPEGKDSLIGQYA